MTTDTGDVGDALDIMTLTPAALPWRRLDTLEVMGAISTSRVVSRDTDPVRSLALAVP